MKHRFVDFLILIALIFGLVFFVSCGMDLGDHPIKGTWEHENGKYVYKLAFTDEYVQYSYDMYRLTNRRGGIKESRIYEKQPWSEASEFSFVSEFTGGTVFPDNIRDTFTLSEDLKTITWTRVATDSVSGDTQVVHDAEVYTKASDESTLSDRCFKAYEQFTYTGMAELDISDAFHQVDRDASSLYLFADGSFLWSDDSCTIAEGSFSYDKGAKLITLNSGSRYLSSVVLRAVSTDSGTYLTVASGSFNFEEVYGSVVDGNFSGPVLWI
ncbi:MAG: hypothetical protein IKP61_01195 [Spirochaetales bacterium]|nr:hypothetical protein [Spirochaetales bacterium]